MMQQLSDSTSVAPRPIPRPRTRLRALPTPARSTPPPAQPLHSETLHSETLHIEKQPLSADPLASLDGLYTAPFGFVLRPLVNQGPRSVPLVLDRPGDLAVVRRALELVAAEGGFDARIRSVWQLEARIHLRGTREPSEVAARLCEHESEVLALAARAIPACANAGAPLAFEVLPGALAGGEVRLCLRLEASDDEPTESRLHDAARAIAPLLIRVAGVRPSVRVSRKSIERARVACHIHR
ncbi:MAG TPA: hypothetical protein VMG12_01435, partial [Polyangiaceae bacterium]|nr:hypothetical protein [Polyangiaceae bacterium]